MTILYPRLLCLLRTFTQDMLSRPNLDKFQVQRMVDNAKELDSRFDKGSVQKSFL